MNKIKKLYQESLIYKWYPILEDIYDIGKGKRSNGIFKKIQKQCPFCYDCDGWCCRCKINKKICSGVRGKKSLISKIFYGPYDQKLYWKTTKKITKLMEKEMNKIPNVSEKELKFEIGAFVHYYYNLGIIFDRTFFIKTKKLFLNMHRKIPDLNLGSLFYDKEEDVIQIEWDDLELSVHWFNGEKKPLLIHAYNAAKRLGKFKLINYIKKVVRRMY